MTSGLNTLALTGQVHAPRGPAAARDRHADEADHEAKPKPTVTPPAVRCVVPKLKGLKLKQARTAAKQANCAVGAVKRKRSAKQRTTVLKQGAAAGTVLARGAKITLTVSR